MIKNVLVPYDGTRLSKKGLELGKQMAQKFDANLRLILIIPKEYPLVEASIYYRAARSDYSRFAKKLQQSGTKEIARVADKLKKEGLKVNYKVINGDIAYSILSEANKTKSDMVIIGSRRMKGGTPMKRLGSIARFVSENAKCPVTIVH